MGGGGSPSQRNDTVLGLSWGNNNVPCVSSINCFRKDLVCVYQVVYKWTYYYYYYRDIYHAPPLITL